MKKCTRAWRRFTVVGPALVAAMGIACAGCASTAASPASVPTLARAGAPATTVIRSPAQLQDYLRAAQVGASPLAALSPGARKRFLSSLRFGPGGVGGFSTADLAQELSTAQIRAVLALFGIADYADDITPSEQPLHGGDAESAIEKRFDVFFAARDNVDRDTRVATMRSAYAQLVAPLRGHGEAAAVSDHDLSLLFRAATVMAAVSASAPRYLHDMRTDLRALADRGQATSQRVQTMHAALVATRRFAAANALATRYPDAGIAVLPPLQAAANLRLGTPSALLLSTDGQTMRHVGVAMDVPLRIVVLAGCHFSVDAVRAIETVPTLARLFHDHAIWLADENESLAAVQTWNGAHPGQPMHVAWRNSEWQRIDRWAIPTFYIFRNGQRIDRWSGWPGHGEGLRTLRQHLRAAGLLPPTPLATSAPAQAG